MVGPELERKFGREAGFTLVELCVVIVVIGILVAVALPTVLGGRSRASDTAAKAKVVQGLKTQRVHYTDAQDYTADPTVLARIDPSVKFAPYDDPSDVQVLGRVYVKAEEGVVTLVARSASGRCYWTKDTNGVTTYASNDCSTEPTVFSRSW